MAAPSACSPSSRQRHDDYAEPAAVARAAARRAARGRRRAVRAADGCGAPHLADEHRRHRTASAGPDGGSRRRERSARVAVGACCRCRLRRRRRVRPCSSRREATGASASWSMPCTKNRSSSSRSCADRLRNQKTFTGAALLGNGDIVPILDVNALFDLASHAPSAEATPAAQRRATARVSRVLVVDDSLVAGELQKNILQAAGYESEIATDGVEALECLRQKDWDLVIADVDMPRMNGFDLTQRIRADEHFRDVPVIIVTSRDTADDRRRGFEAGADAYVLKREFDQGQLLDTVRRLIGRSTGTGRACLRLRTAGAEGPGPDRGRLGRHPRGADVAVEFRSRDSRDRSGSDRRRGGRDDGDASSRHRDDGLDDAGNGRHGSHAPDHGAPSDAGPLSELVFRQGRDVHAG